MNYNLYLDLFLMVALTSHIEPIKGLKGIIPNFHRALIPGLTYGFLGNMGLLR
jgi:hypothetical protein